MAVGVAVEWLTERGCHCTGLICVVLRSSTAIMSTETPAARPARTDAQDDTLFSFDMMDCAPLAEVARWTDARPTGSSSSTMTFTGGSAVQPLPPPPSSTGLVPRAVNSHTFSGHDAKWLNEKEMKQVLGRIPAPLERPSLLNALAYKCGAGGWNGPPCVVKQCTTQLDEINVFVLRQQYAAQCLAMGYSGANKAEPICGVLLDRYDKVQKTFRSFVVKVPGRDGVEQDIPLCGPAWAAVVPNAGYSTFTKLRADVTQGRITRENILPGNMPAKKLLLTMGDGAGQGGEDKGEMEFRLLKSYVRELATTLEHAPVPGGARELE